MLLVSATPRLKVRRPSPTVAEFTVTTLLAPTPALRLLRALLLAGLRLFLGLATLLVVLVIVLVRWAVAAPSKPPSPVKAAVLTCASLLPAGIIRLTLPLLLAAGAGVLFLVARRFHVRESLLVLRGLGVQTSESSYLTAAATRFIPTEKIQDIFVNEAFRGFEVRYYLVIVVDGESDLVVVFPKLLPSRKIVEIVWRGARECLYEGRAENKG